MLSRRSTAEASAAPPVRWGAVRLVVQMMRTLFVHQLRVRRIEGRLVVRLEDTPVRPAPGAPGTAHTGPLDFTRGELTALLDAAPRSRALLRYLAAVEHGLKRKDADGLFLFEAQLERLQAALRQLDGLLPAQPTPGLAALRTRLKDAIDAHEKNQRQLDMLMPRSNLLRDSRIEVAEGRSSDFERIDDEWQGRPPR